jgi:hypothetical protein
MATSEFREFTTGEVRRNPLLLGTLVNRGTERSSLGSHPCHLGEAASNKSNLARAGIAMPLDHYCHSIPCMGHNIPDGMDEALG